METGPHVNELKSDAADRYPIRGVGVVPADKHAGMMRRCMAVNRSPIHDAQDLQDVCNPEELSQDVALDARFSKEQDEICGVQDEELNEDP